MLTEMRLQNFKAWKDTGKIRLAPITVFFGANSAGKTSLLQFLLMLKQTAESPDRRRVLHLGDPYSLVELGNFRDISFRHADENTLDLLLSWELPKTYAYKDPTGASTDIRGSFVTFRANLRADSRGIPTVNFFA